MSELNKIAILIVEDEALIAEDIKDICESCGYIVSPVCYRAKQAMAAIDTEDIDIVLMDINLEDELSGIDLARYIHNNKKSIPVIFLTSYTDSKTLEQAKDVMPMGYVVKPFNKEQLVSTIEISLFNFAKFSLPAGYPKKSIERVFHVIISDREYEILTLICEGKTNAQIAVKIYLSVNTIKFHIKNLYEKLQVNSRTQLLSILRARII